MSRCLSAQSRSACRLDASKCPVGDAHGGPRRDLNPMPEREDRIEHGAHRVRQRPAIHHGNRRMHAVTTAEESRAVGLEFRLADVVPSTTARCPAQSSASSGRRFRRVARMSPISGRYSVSTKSLEKAGCGHVVGLGCQGQFGIGSHVDLSCADSVVGDGYAPHLRIILGRDKHIESGRQAFVGRLNSARSSLKSPGSRPADAAWLESSGPYCAAVDVPEEDVGP